MGGGGTGIEGRRWRWWRRNRDGGVEVEEKQGWVDGGGEREQRWRMGVEKENKDGGWRWRKRTKMEGWRAGGGGDVGETGVEAVTVKAELKR